MKKLTSLILAAAMILGLCLPCSATETQGEYLSDADIREMCSTYEELSEPTTRYAGPPSEVYNCHTRGTYGFSGEASYSTLWLNYYIYGCTKYLVYLANNSDTTLTYTIHGATNAGTYTLGAHEYVYLTFSMATSDTMFCISFEAPSNFSGLVSCQCG